MFGKNMRGVVTSVEGFFYRLESVRCGCPYGQLFWNWSFVIPLSLFFLCMHIKHTVLTRKKESRRDSWRENERAWERKRGKEVKKLKTPIWTDANVICGKNQFHKPILSKHTIVWLTHYSMYTCPIHMHTRECVWMWEKRVGCLWCCFQFFTVSSFNRRTISHLKFKLRCVKKNSEWEL